MKAWKGAAVELGHGRPLAAQLHGRALAAGLPVGRLRREAEYAEILKATLEMDDLIATHSAIMDKYDPEKKSRSSSTSGAPGTRRCPGSNGGLPRPAEQPARRHPGRAQPQHLRPPRRPRPHGQHRADDQRAQAVAVIALDP